MNRRSFLKTSSSLLAAGAIWASTPVLAANDKKAIVIYYSRTGTVEVLAKMIAEKTGAEMCRLDVKEKYAPNYSDMTDIARSEVRSGARRELETTIPDLSGINVVFLGTPYWWGSVSVPMATFLMDHPLEGKTVYPFVTSASSSPDGAFNRIRELCPKATMGESFYSRESHAASAKADVEAWLSKIGF